METYDIVVLGSGLAGSMTALVLGQVGARTLVVEARAHPRFAIGESTLPTTSLLLHQLAARYDLPELAQLSHYTGLKEAGCTAWAKQHFWFGLHAEERSLDPGRECLLETMTLPIGPDVHMLRADADAFLVEHLAARGVDYVDHTRLESMRSDEDGAVLTLQGPNGVYEVRARFVVDATGHSSLLSRQYGLRDANARLHTNTRSIFGHFRGVPELDDVLGGPNPDFRFCRSAGTMHHCFDGGWIWVIPFDNGITSVGVQLDRRQAPLDPSVSSADELAAIVARYPSVQAHLGAMEPVRPLVRTDRVQFTSRSILGDRFILTPHAAAFVDPLFSTGIVFTAAFVSRFASEVQEALRDGNWDSSRFAWIESRMREEVQHVDHLIDGTIQSFRNPDLFRAYWHNWVIGTLSQWSMTLLAGEAPRALPMVHGAGMPGFGDALMQMHTLVCDRETDPRELASKIRACWAAHWEKVCGGVIQRYGVEQGGSLSLRGADGPEPLMARLVELAGRLARLDPGFCSERVEAYFCDTQARRERLCERYSQSRADGTAFAPAVDRILANAIPQNFDYATDAGL